MINREALKLYAITDRECLKGRELIPVVEQAILGGVTCIQLRDKTLDEAEIFQEASMLVPICRKYGVPLIVDDDFHAALKAGADGVHVGQEDAPVTEIRRIAGNKFIIGATAKTVAQAVQAEKDGADYLGVGAVFPSPTKTNAIRISPEILKDICSSVSIPVTAIGGISADNIREIKNCGQAGIAVVSAVFGADDVKAAAEKLIKILSEQ